MKAIDDVVLRFLQDALWDSGDLSEEVVKALIERRKRQREYEAEKADECK